jgi:hypothetical protein
MRKGIFMGAAKIFSEKKNHPVCYRRRDSFFMAISYSVAGKRSRNLWRVTDLRTQI